MRLYWSVDLRARARSRSPDDRITPAEAGDTLAGMLSTLGLAHPFLPDDQAATAWLEWCRIAGQTIDAHLMKLAERHRALLATSDHGIPGAFCLLRAAEVERGIGRPQSGGLVGRGLIGLRL